MDRLFNKPITEVVKARRSVRTFMNTKLSKEIEDKLIDYINDVKTPLGTSITYKLIATDIAERMGGRIGTYGIIRGANSYIVAKIKKGDNELLDLGYTLQSIILFAASLGLGTCWLGGTFNRGRLFNLLEVKDGELIPAITPIGYPAERKSFIEAAMSGLAASRKRKDSRELFFQDSFEEPLDMEKNHPYSIPLEMVRLAPSAANKQPWRILRNSEGWHFYLKGDMPAAPMGFNMQIIDIGIAMCHFELTLMEMGIKGTWVKIDSSLEQKQSKLHYMISWREDK